MQSGEVDATSYVCNGTNGTDGAQGPPGEIGGTQTWTISWPGGPTSNGSPSQDADTVIPAGTRLTFDPSLSTFHAIGDFSVCTRYFYFAVISDGNYSEVTYDPAQGGWTVQEGPDGPVTSSDQSLRWASDCATPGPYIDVPAFTATVVFDVNGYH